VTARPLEPLRRAAVYEDCPFAKLVPSSEFAADERWDVIRHWTDEEYVALGERAETIPRGEFIDVAMQTLQDLMLELQQAKEDLARLSSGSMGDFSLADDSLFHVRSGVRIRNVDLRAHPGDIPVYSVFTRPDTIKGYVNAEWLETAKGVRPEAFPSATVMATGASAVGMVFYREAHCVMTDDVVMVQPWSAAAALDALRIVASRLDDSDLTLPAHNIDLGYLVVALSQSIAQGGYLYEAKLYTTRVRQLSIAVPVDAAGKPDIVRQRNIAAVSKRIDEIRAKMQEAGSWSRKVRLA
jgi:hypothetical protein